MNQKIIDTIWRINTNLSLLMWTTQQTSICAKQKIVAEVMYEGEEQRGRLWGRVSCSSVMANL